MQTAITRTSGPGRVLLVDDHPAVRRVLRSLLEEVGGWQVVGEADSGEAALPLVEQLAPDVVLMDCRMPGAGGVAATREIVKRWPEVAVVAHTAYADETYVREMVAAGARGYVLKGDVPAAVLEALSAARQGQARLSAAVTGPVMEDLRELYEAAVNRSKELEAAERRPQLLRWPGWRRSTASRTSSWPWSATSCGPRSRSSSAWPRPWSGGPTWPPPPTARRSSSGSSARASACATWSSSSSRRARSWPTAARCCGPRRSWPPTWSAEVVDDWRLAEPDRRVELRLPERPRSLHGDAEALRMVVGNLVDNAGKHAPPGTPIRVLVTQPHGLTRIEVADQGDGVAAIDRERIFAPFTQLDASTTRRVGGVGLGLFLVDRLVRGMGGRVWVEDNPGGGARFVVELPDLAPV